MEVSFQLRAHDEIPAPPEKKATVLLAGTLCGSQSCSGRGGE